MSKGKICIFRAGGTNCDLETKRALEDFPDVEAEIVRINDLKNSKDLMEYDALVLPGGFSYGDHIRAGAVFSMEIMTKLGDELREFAEDGRPIIGICNGFQVLIETGLLPGFKGISESPEASLAINESARFECRWIHIKNENRGNCIFTKEVEEEKTLYMPVAHMEGRFILEKENEKSLLKRLIENDQIVFRYSHEGGEYAKGEYPQNPNGALHDIAGICDPDGRIFGLMPHPERAYNGFQLPHWTNLNKTPRYADGRLIFKSLVDYLKKNFLP